ncbi:gamma-tubulin complex component 6 isoform X2 [Amblyomma americanum]
MEVVDDIPTLVTKLCALVASGAKSDVPVKELRKLAFSILLKLDNRPRTSCGGDVWNAAVEDRIVAKAFEMQLQSRHQDALRLRACLAQLRGGRQHCSMEVQACLEFLLHMADTGPARREARRRLFELPPLASGSTQVPAPICLVPGVPAFPEYSRESFECIDNDLEASDDQGNPVPLLGLYKAEPGFDLNGNPLFSLHVQRSPHGASHPQPFSESSVPKVPSLNAFTRNRVLTKLSKSTAKLEPLPVTTRTCKQVKSQPPLQLPQTTAHANAPTLEDWLQAMQAEKRRHFTWESIGCVSSAKEKPYVSEAGVDAAEIVCQLQTETPATLTGAERVEASCVEQKDLVRKMLLLLVGVPSDCFPYDPVSRQFSLKGGTRLKGTSSEALTALLSRLLECGNDVRFLEDLVSNALPANIKPTLTWQAFVGGLKRYLHFFHGCVIPVASRADTLSVLELNHIVSCLVDHVRCIADISRGAVKLQGASSQGLQSMELMHSLQQHAERFWGQEEAPTAAFLLWHTCQPYLRFLKEWLYEGRCNDPHREFPIQVNREHVEMRDECFWENGFTLQLAAPAAPLAADFLGDVFTSAKAAKLLKVCKPQSPVLWSQHHRPVLTIAFGSRQLDEIEASAEHYTLAMKQELKLAPLPEPSLGLISPHVEVPQDWVKVQEEQASAKSRLLFAIPRSPSSNTGRLLSPSMETAPAPPHASPLAAPADQPQEDLLYSVTTGTHMRVTGKSGGHVAEPTKQATGLYCEASGTYGRGGQRNIFGHASDSQLRNILYPDILARATGEEQKGAEGDCAAEDGIAESSEVESGQGATDLVVSSSGPASKSESAVGMLDSARLMPQPTSGDGPEGCVEQSGELVPSATSDPGLWPLASQHSSDCSSREEDEASQDSRAWQKAAGSKEAGGDHLDALEGWISGQGLDDPVRAEDGGGDASILEADAKPHVAISGNQFLPECIAKSYSTYSKVISQEPLESSRLAYFSPGDASDSSANCDSWDWSLDGGLCRLPLEVVLRRSLLPPLTAQMKLLNRVCVSYFVTELRLYDHLEALVNYYCFQDGEFGQALCDAICHELKSPMSSPAEFLNPRTLNLVLAHALSSSLHGDRPEASNLNLDARRIPSVILPGQNILSCLSMNYEVQWPLNLVITKACLLRYNRIFSFLLNLRRAMWALSDIWSHLKPSALPRDPYSSLEFRRLQLMRHEMLHFVHLVQSYVGGQVMQASLAELRAELIGKAHTVDDLRNVHLAFLKRLSQRLLLGRRAAPVYKLLREALKTALFFQAELAKYSWRVEGGSQLTHPCFSKFVTVHAKFQQIVATLQTAWLSDAMGSPSIEGPSTVKVPDELSHALRGAKLQHVPLA